MYMPAQTQLKTVKMVEIGPESDVRLKMARISSCSASPDGNDGIALRLARAEGTAELLACLASRCSGPGGGSALRSSLRDSPPFCGNAVIGTQYAGTA